MQCLGRWPATSLTARRGGAARIGVSPDTLRRWDRAGKLRTVRDDAQPPPRAARARSSGCARARSATRPGDALSARNRFPGVVRSVEVDGVMALVEIEAGPVPRHRGDHARRGRGARPRAGRAGHGGGEGDLGDGRAAGLRCARRLTVALLAASRSAAAAATTAAASGDGGEAAPGRLGRLVADRGAHRLRAGRSTDADVQLPFAGSDELAAQIRQGVKPDVFAAANTKLPDAAATPRAWSSKPVVFATNQLVLAVPDGLRQVDSRRRPRPSRARRSRSARSPCRSAPTRARCSARLPADAGEGDPRQRALRASPTSRASSASSTQGAVDAGLRLRHRRERRPTAS